MIVKKSRKKKKKKKRKKEEEGRFMTPDEDKTGKRGGTDQRRPASFLTPLLPTYTLLL